MKCSIHPLGYVVFDGFRRCVYSGGQDGVGQPDGTGILIYENKDTFRGEFSHGVLNRKGVLTRTDRLIQDLSLVQYDAR